MKNYIGTNEIFHTKAKKRIGFFFDRSFLLGALFHENWQYCKMGQKQIFQLSRVNTPCDISSSLFIITDPQYRTKTKIGGRLCSQGLKKGLKIQKSKNFDGFSFSKNDVFRTVPLISMISHQIKKILKILKISKKICNFQPKNGNSSILKLFDFLQPCGFF